MKYKEIYEQIRFQIDAKREGKIWGDDFLQ